MIDTDIFQIVTLVLLLLALLVSLVGLSSLGKIRKRLEEAGAAPGAPREPATPAEEPMAASAPVAAQARPAATAHPLEEASYGGAAQPAAAQPGAAQPAARSAAPVAAEERQDEPFEKDGRWWFRRGDELLVYEESTGQWQPAGTAGGDTAGGTTQMPAVDETAAGTEGGAHWKCPTCGAVNGSTAASCRMCFTARP
ncbi:MAG: hypothetical protein GEU78_09385 [Actinobacteria bacterium]|nr:hypothetical protein [Actinomycetota bacterium]